MLKVGESIPILHKNSISNTGKVLHFYMNYSDQIQNVVYNIKNGRELLSNNEVMSNGKISMQPWDVAIVEEK